MWKMLITISQSLKVKNLTVIKEKVEQQMLTFKKLEPENVWQFHWTEFLNF